MRVLVTGGAGFIGSHVVDHLVALGTDVGVLDNMSSGDGNNLHEAFRAGLDEADVHICDVRDRRAASIIRSFCPDVVVHLAAQTNVHASFVDPSNDASVNVTGAVNVMHAAVTAGAKKVVFAASCAIYGAVTELDLPVTEALPWSPTTPYGMSKATGLRYLQLNARNHGIDYAGLVLGNVYGPRQRMPSVIPAFLNSQRRGSRPQLFGGGLQSRDFVYVTDVAHALVAACRRGDELIANIGSGTETRILDLYRQMAATVGGDVEPVTRPGEPGDLPRMRLDIRRAASVLRWVPRVGLADGLTYTVESARGQPVDAAVLVTA